MKISGSALNFESPSEILSQMKKRVPILKLNKSALELIIRILKDTKE